MSDVSRILSEIDAGDPNALERLLPMVYDELRHLAAKKLAAEKPGQTLDATGLVHEVYLRMFGPNANSQSWNSRAHFLAAAAQGMRRILIDRARKRSAQKRGGNRKRFDLELDDVSAPMPDQELVALNDALQQLSELDAQKAQLVELRYFVGLTGDEAARVLGISPATADRYWAYARAWLQSAVQDNQD